MFNVKCQMSNVKCQMIYICTSMWLYDTSNYFIFYYSAYRYRCTKCTCKWNTVRVHVYETLHFCFSAWLRRGEFRKLFKTGYMRSYFNTVFLTFSDFLTSKSINHVVYNMHCCIHNLVRLTHSIQLSFLPRCTIFMPPMEPYSSNCWHFEIYIGLSRVTEV